MNYLFCIHNHKHVFICIYTKSLHDRVETYVTRQCVKTQMPTHGDYTSKISLCDAVVCQRTHTDSWGLQLEKVFMRLGCVSTHTCRLMGTIARKNSLCDAVMRQDTHTD